MKLHIAVIGAGPVGLSLALHAARALPDAGITVYDTRAQGVDVTRDPRTLAMSLGSIQLLQRLKAWRAEASQPIAEVHVSQQAPHLGGRPLPDPRVRISAAREGVDQLGAVMSYGDIVAPLEAVWQAAVAREPERLQSRFGTTVASLQNMAARDGAGALVTTLAGNRVGVGSGTDPHGRSEPDDESGPGPDRDPDMHRFDLAIVAEGGVFADQARKSVRHDYRQTAWVGKVELALPHRGTAYERFTASGPAALLPLPQPLGDASRAGTPTSRAALVWCVPSDADPVRDVSDEDRIALLNKTFHADVGGITGISPLKHFALGLNAERTLVDGRIVRIGNAAQTLHPVAGQGLNLGMRDAFELVSALSKAASIDEALRSMERRRAPDRWAMIVATDFLARSFTWQMPGLAGTRGLALAALEMATPLKSFIARQMMFGRR